MLNKIRYPEFFIVGAPKCGTTSIYNYLRQHPQVFLPNLKEPHYYSLDYPGLRVVSTKADYIKMFDAAPVGNLIGEASASYIHSLVAIKLVLEEVPNAKFIAILRNPVEMVYSLHSELMANLSEDESNFERAWSLQGPRARGECLPSLCTEPRMLQYLEVCSLGNHLRRFVNLVPARQRLILLLDDLRRDPAHSMEMVLDFLSLPQILPTIFEQSNSSRQLRSRRLAILHRKLPELLGPLYQPLKRVGNMVGIRPSSIMDRLNIEKCPRQPIDPEFEAELRHVLEPQILLLESLLKRDLSNWRDANAFGVQ